MIHYTYVLRSKDQIAPIDPVNYNNNMFIAPFTPVDFSHVEKKPKYFKLRCASLNLTSDNQAQIIEVQILGFSNIFYQSSDGNNGWMTISTHDLYYVTLLTRQPEIMIGNTLPSGQIQVRLVNSKTGQLLDMATGVDGGWTMILEIIPVF